MIKKIFRAFCILPCVVFLFSCRNVDLMDEPEAALSEHSSTVSVDDAKMVALNFFNKQDIPLQASVSGAIPTFESHEIDEVQTLGDDDNIPILYVINLKDNKGFVVMSASELEKPILAYGNSGKFSLDDIEKSIGIMNWIEQKHSKIHDLIKEDKEPEEWIIQQWIQGGVTPRRSTKSDLNISASTSSYTQRYKKTKGPLLKTNWDQSSYSKSYDAYNNFVKYNNCSSGKTPAGCVAVAMGQIMKYHNWPNIYNIKNMPNYVDYNNYKDYNSINIAKMLKYIGEKVNMDYGCSGSGAYSENARRAFISNFNYSTSELVDANLNIMRQNIDANKPVYMEGCKERKTVEVVRIRYKKFLWWRIRRIRDVSYQTQYDKCHAWVADGYLDESGKSIKFHMNWGWGGYKNDGWYDYENVDSNESVTRYKYVQKMIYNITPNR